jgi:uncharacterized pyridoxal phosphate-containing UPF0001 family protein
LRLAKRIHPKRIRGAIAAGQITFGENKVQEAESKIDEVGREGIEWHLIGHLQSNKARKRYSSSMLSSRSIRSN